MKWNEAAGLLEECERGLRDLVVKAAGEGDYASVQRIADLAKAVSALAVEGRSVPIAAMASRPTSVGQDAALGNGDTVGGPTTRKPNRFVEEYPKFFRRGDELVKIGWSKTQRTEYNHRAPRAAIDATASAVRRVGAKGRLFNGGALLPLKHPTDGSDIPDYQGYVALAWLKHLGIVEQHGRRGGYTLVPGKQIDSTTTAAWPELAEWRG